MWIPKFEYPTGGTALVLTRPMGLWTRTFRAQGGRFEPANGPAVARTVRRRYYLDLLVRFKESEYTAVETMVAWLQDNPANPASIWPDHSVAGTSYPFLMIHPVQNEDFEPQRDSQYPSDWALPMTIERSTGTPWPLNFYPGL